MKWIKNSWYLLVAMELNFIAGLWIGSNPDAKSAIIPGAVWFALFGIWVWSKNSKVW